MGFTLQGLVERRPFAFHSSCRENFDAIRRRGMLRSAAEILQGTRHEYLLRSLRKSSEAVEVGGETVVVRDNKPLRPGSVRLLDGWSLEDLLLELNSRVFLWPGTEAGPIRRGRAHFERYAAEGPVLTIRMPTASLLAANPERDLWVTRCNSGSARHHSGKPVPRGRSTFQRPETAAFSPAEVIELTYVGRARLPRDAEWSESLEGPWRALKFDSTPPASGVPSA